MKTSCCFSNSSGDTRKWSLLEVLGLVPPRVALVRGAGPPGEFFVTIIIDFFLEAKWLRVPCFLFSRKLSRPFAEDRYFVLLEDLPFTQLPVETSNIIQGVRR